VHVFDVTGDIAFSISPKIAVGALKRLFHAAFVDQMPFERFFFLVAPPTLFTLEWIPRTDN